MIIYLAGKITKNGWRTGIVGHGNLSYSAPDENMKQLTEWPVRSNMIFDEHHYTGPYFISDDHASAHGDNTHGVQSQTYADYDINPTQRQVYKFCMRAIEKSTLIFAWIDSADCYGTIAELGYAHGLNKEIHIASPRYINDLWFVYKLATGRVDIKHESAEQALKWYLDAGSYKNMPYQKYLTTDHWHKVRIDALEKANNHCQVCNKSTKLEVHHRTYDNLGEEKPEDLIVLCDDCHGLFHSKLKLSR